VRLKEKTKLADGSVGDVAVLKRVHAPDKEALGIVRTEVDTMVDHAPNKNHVREMLTGIS
jgi:AP2-associated kinase